MGLNTEERRKVSVVIPTYNRPAYLTRAVQSVLEQTFTDYEIVVVDDGSTEDVRGALQPYGELVRYAWRENGGSAAARNTGIGHSVGEYLCFLDDDDYFLPGKLACQVQAMDEHPEVGVVVGGRINADENGVPFLAARPWSMYTELDFQTWLLAHPATMSSMMFRRDWLERVGGFDEQLRRNEDCDLLIRLTYSGCGAMWVKEFVCVQRDHATNKRRDVYQQALAHDKVLDKFFAAHSLPHDATVTKEEVYALSCLGYAFREYAAGQIEEARAHLHRAMQLMPALSAEKSGVIMNTLVGCGARCATEDVGSYIQTVLDHLPDELWALRRYRRRLTGKVWAAKAFAAHSVRNYKVVRHAVLAAVLRDPGCLSNHGILSIWGESLVGPRVAQSMRQLLHR